MAKGYSDAAYKRKLERERIYAREKYRALSPEEKAEQNRRRKENYNKEKERDPEALREKWRRKYKKRKVKDPEGLREANRRKYEQRIERDPEFNKRKCREYYQRHKDKILARQKRNHLKRKAAKGLDKLERQFIDGEINSTEFIRRYTNELISSGG